MLTDFIAIVLIAMPIVVIALLLWIFSLRRIVPTNEVHVVQRATKTTIYGKGVSGSTGNTYYEFPAWVPVLGTTVTQLPTAVFDLDLSNYEAYDKDRLPFVVDIKSFFRIADFDLASSRVASIKELREQLAGIVQGAARSLLAKENLEAIMSERNKYGLQFTEEVIPQLKEWGVHPVKNIELMDIRDSRESKVISNIMAKKKSQIEMESRVTVAENLKKAQEAEILANQEVQLRSQDAEQKVGLKRAQVSQEVGVAQEKSAQIVREQAKVTAEKEMEVERVKTVQAAEIEREASIVKADKDKSVVVICAEAAVEKADADKKVTILNAEASKENVVLKAEAELVSATNNAKGIEAKGRAEAESARLMQLAPVSAQVELADKIGSNTEYQEFILNQKKIEAMAEVGKEQARNLSNADIKIFANSGSVSEGVSNASGIFTSKNGLNVASMVESFMSTPAGEAIASRILSKDSK